MWHNLKGILFDKDGTLFDYEATWGEWVRQVTHRLSQNDAQLQGRLMAGAGYDPSTKSFEEGAIFVAGTVDDLFEIWAAVMPNLSLARLEEVGLQEFQNVPAVPACDLSALLRRLKGAGIKLGVATNDYEQSAVKQLQDAGVEDLFDVILGYDSGPIPKPAPDMVLEFCRRVEIAPEVTAMVGDSTHDLLAGQRARAKTIGVLTGPASADGLTQADAVLPNIADLPELLNLQK